MAEIMKLSTFRIDLPVVSPKRAVQKAQQNGEGREKKQQQGTVFNQRR